MQQPGGQTWNWGEQIWNGRAGPEWHPKIWKLRHGFALYWSKTIWGKHAFLLVAIATDGCNVIGRRNFLAQKLEAKIVSMVSVHCHVHRLASACYFPAAHLYSVVYETANALQCKFHRCDRLSCRCIRLRDVMRLDDARDKKQVWCPHVRTQGLSEAKLLLKKVHGTWL